MLKDLKANVIVYQKVFSRIIPSLWPTIDSDIKLYKEIRKSPTGQGKNYIVGCFLDYGYIKNYYRLIVVDLNRQKEMLILSNK